MGAGQWEQATCRSSRGQWEQGVCVPVCVCQCVCQCVCTLLEVDAACAQTQVGFGANIGALVTGVRTAFVLSDRVKRDQEEANRRRSLEEQVTTHRILTATQLKPLTILIQLTTDSMLSPCVH